MFNFNSSKRHRETPTSPTSRSAFSRTMNPLSNPNLLKLSAFIFISFVFFYLGKHWSDGYQQLVFFSTSPSSRNADVSFSSNSNKSYHISSLIPQNETQSPSQFHIVPSPSSDSIQKFGIITENGTMSDEFEIGEYDTDLVETEWGNDNGTEKTDSGRGRAMIKRFSMCSEDTREIIPCLDNSEAIKRLKSTDKGEKFERHCPQNGTGLNCLVPPPEGYKQPIPWPKSRDEMGFCCLRSIGCLGQEDTSLGLHSQCINMKKLRGNTGKCGKPDNKDHLSVSPSAIMPLCTQSLGLKEDED